MHQKVLSHLTHHLERRVCLLRRVIESAVLHVLAQAICQPFPLLWQLPAVDFDKQMAEMGFLDGVVRHHLQISCSQVQMHKLALTLHYSHSKNLIFD